MKTSHLGMLREYLRKICALWSPGGTLAAKMSGEEMEATGGNPELYFLLENIGFCIFSQDLGAEYSRRPRKEIFGRVSSSPIYEPSSKQSEKKTVGRRTNACPRLRGGYGCIECPSSLIYRAAPENSFVPSPHPTVSHTQEK